MITFLAIVGGIIGWILGMALLWLICDTLRR